ncbi:hypothetical protein [Prosthecobacter sp.]|uniref:hypothetical protein n=1 Tax=Prosthecobacter sp. TaxID=1965333 RepID=UPI002489B05C|nr:hypothetical protein [Prosthecobacter sp.]MDI1314579.1 hypothetical protein [Prosthecobacter sp.]
MNETDCKELSITGSLNKLLYRSAALHQDESLIDGGTILKQAQKAKIDPTMRTSAAQASLALYYNQ